MVQLWVENYNNNNMVENECWAGSGWWKWWWRFIWFGEEWEKNNSVKVNWASSYAKQPNSEDHYTELRPTSVRLLSLLSSVGGNRLVSPCCSDRVDRTVILVLQSCWPVVAGEANLMRLWTALETSAVSHKDFCDLTRTMTTAGYKPLQS